MKIKYRVKERPHGRKIIKTRISTKKGEKRLNISFINIEFSMEDNEISLTEGDHVECNTIHGYEDNGGILSLESKSLYAIKTGKTFVSLWPRGFIEDVLIKVDVTESQ